MTKYLDGIVLANSPPPTLSKLSFSALCKDKLSRNALQHASFQSSIISPLGMANRLSQTEKRLLLESLDPTETPATSEALSW